MSQAVSARTTIPSRISFVSAGALPPQAFRRRPDCRPPLRSIGGIPVRFDPHVDQAIAEQAASNGRTFEEEAAFVIGQFLQRQQSGN